MAAVVVELWVIFAVPLAWALSRDRGRYRRPRVRGMVCMVGACAGAGLVVAGQSGLASGDGVPEWTLLLGGVLGLLSALAVAATVALFRWSEELVVRLPVGAADGYGAAGLELFGTAVGIFVSGTAVAVCNAGAGVAVGEWIGVWQAVAAVVLGAVVYFGANVLWRLANLVTVELSVNALASFTPVMALGWVWGWQVAGLPGGELLLAVPRADLLAAGAAVVVVANLGLGYVGRKGGR